MKKFLKDGFDTITKLIVTQLGMTMFGLMVTMATRAMPGASKENDPMLLAVSLVSTIMYLFILYFHIWEKGAKDRIKVDGGRMEKQTLKGLYLSLVANSLNILLGLIMCSTYYFCDFVNGLDSIQCQIFGSANDIARLIQGMYTGLIIYISPDAQATSPFIFLAIVIPALVVTSLGYYFGFKNMKVFKSGNAKR